MYKKERHKPAFSYEWLLFKNNFFKNDCMFTDKTIKDITLAIQEVIDAELLARENIESYLKKNEIMYTQESFNYKLPYDCSVCPNLNYMSYQECKTCKKKECITHNLVCKCSTKALVLYYRFNSDLKYYSKGKIIDSK